MLLHFPFVEATRFCVPCSPKIRCKLDCNRMESPFASQPIGGFLFQTDSVLRTVDAYLVSRKIIGENCVACFVLHVVNYWLVFLVDIIME